MFSKKKPRSSLGFFLICRQVIHSFLNCLANFARQKPLSHFAHENFADAPRRWHSVSSERIQWLSAFGIDVDPDQPNFDPVSDKSSWKLSAQSEKMIDEF